MIGVSDIVIELSDKENSVINKKIEKFVEEMGSKKQSTTYYTQNRNVKAEKAAEDIFLGKKAEFFVCIALNKHFNIPLIEPDLEIRKGKKKGWGADIPLVQYGHRDMHVKSCSAKTYKYCKDYSWTFQYSNNNGVGGKDKLLKQESNDLISLVYIIQPNSNIGTIKAILDWEMAKKYLKDPLKPTLIGLKKCLYYEDLINGI